MVYACGRIQTYKTSKLYWNHIKLCEKFQLKNWGWFIARLFKYDLKCCPSMKPSVPWDLPLRPPTETSPWDLTLRPLKKTSRRDFPLRPPEETSGRDPLLWSTPETFSWDLLLRHPFFIGKKSTSFTKLVKCKYEKGEQFLNFCTFEKWQIYISWY